MKKKLSLLIGSCLLFIGITTSVKAEEVFNLGLVFCETGGCANVGRNTIRGVQLALDEINAAGGLLGRRVLLIARDSKEADSAMNAVTAFQSVLRAPNVNYIIGPTWSNGGMPLIPLVKSNPNLLMISPSLGVAEFNESSDRLFNTWPHDADAVKELARWASAKGNKTAGILAAQDPWTQSMANYFKTEFESLGGKVLAFQEPLLTSANIKPELTKIREKNPDFILIGYWEHVAMAARELKNMKWKGQLASIQMDDEHLALGGADLNGLAYTSFPEVDEEFAKRYEKRFNAPIGIASASAYDAVYALKNAIEEVKSFDVNLVKSAILRQNFKGAAGIVAFDSLGGIKRTPIIVVHKAP